MRKVVLQEFVSLDGLVAGPNATEGAEKELIYGQ